MNALDCGATVTSVETRDERVELRLDQTVFYPQGGGQPCDTGKITAPNGDFIVESVRWVDGDIVHYGYFESGTFMAGDIVSCWVDEERRKINTRNHSGGHLLDLALRRLGIHLVPGKGYHFPEGPYVEYQGEVEEDFAEKLEAACNELIAENVKTRVQMMSREEAADLCEEFGIHLVPDGKPMRVVFYGDFGVPCGGTHVNELSEIGHLRIRKVKSKKGKVHVKYAVD